MTDAAAPHLAQAFPAAEELGAHLAAAGLTVAVAESCTGGLLGAVLTSVPGSSRYVRGGVIAYADDVKNDLLGVPAALLRAHGAVSEEVARAMAVGARRRCSADIGIAVTGVAGPGGESAEKPVGLIHVAVAGPGSAVVVAAVHGDAGREPNRARAVLEAIRLCREALS